MALDPRENGGQSLTTDPVSATPANVAGQDAEFVDCDGLRQRFGIKRSLAYELLHEGAIRGVSLRRRGAQRGKRLFAVDSIRAFLRKQMEVAK